MMKKLLERFLKKNCKKKKKNEKSLELKVIKTKGDTLHVEWKSYGNSFNSWIDKKDMNYMSECFS